MRDTSSIAGPTAPAFPSTRGSASAPRLSIVDVAHGHPMASDDGALQVVYNGEVFNHPTLMRDLQAQGCTYHTHCHTETVLKLYERHGHRTPEQLRGMFAFAMWDRRTRELFLARDRFGVKPLYYVHADDGSLFFASEIKALLAGGAVRAELNLAAFPDFLANHAPSGDDTCSPVRRLPPPHLTWRDGKIEIAATGPALRAGRAGDGRDDRTLVANTESGSREAVRLRSRADVPICMFLSGGIDSAACSPRR